MAAGAEELVGRTWAAGGEREVYADFNALTLRIVTDALFGSETSSPDSRAVTGAPAAPDCGGLSPAAAERWCLCGA